jgi:hypothetical protein
MTFLSTLMGLRSALPVRGEALFPLVLINTWSRSAVIDPCHFMNGLG